MITLILIGVSVLSALAYIVLNRENLYVTTTTTDHWGDKKKKTDFNTAIVRKAIFILVAGLLISIIQPFKYSRVDSGYVGVKVNLTGSDRGISDIKYTTGWVLYNTWTEELYEYPKFQQHIDYEREQVILKGGFPTHITPTFNYKLKTDKVTEMFAELRLPLEDIEKGWLRTAIMSSVNDVSNKWEVDKIFANREKFEHDIINECNKRIGMWFEISLLRTNITPPESLQQSIVAKTKAIQDAEAKIQQAEVAKAEGQRRVAKAKADSSARIIDASSKAAAMLVRAKADAEAIRIKQQEITPVYNDFIRASKWDGRYPTTVAGGSSGFLMQMK